MIITGLSGNEIWCLAQKDIAPGGLVVGNSVHSQGFVRGLTTSLKTFAGGELTAPGIVTEQRLLDLEREVFLSLCGEQKTLERIAHTLKTGKPLRN